MSYTTLKANIQNYLENDSSELVDSIDVIIAQAEEMVFQRYQTFLVLGIVLQVHLSLGKLTTLLRLVHQV